MTDIAISLSPGSAAVVSLRLLVPAVGVWLADLELDANASGAPESGRVTIAIGSPAVATLSGTIDPRGSGGFAGRKRVRVIGGAAGWDQTVSPQHFHSDAGVASARVYQSTATQVGEVVEVASPRTFPADYVRSAGPASRVFEDEPSWWVAFDGVTRVGPRLLTSPPAGLVLVDYEPSTQTAHVACAGPVVPGTALVDTRLPGGGPVIVRDVEQRWDGQGGTAVLWCGVSPAAQLMGDLRALVEEFSGRAYLATYEYRVIAQNDDGRLQLQAVRKAAGLPDVLPIAPWTGQGGASAKLRPGSRVRVAFVEGDPARPLVDSYEPEVIPLEATIDGEAAVHVGPSAAVVQLAGGARPVAMADLVLAELVKIGALLNNIVPGSYVPPASVGASKVVAT